MKVLAVNEIFTRATSRSTVPFATSGTVISAGTIVDTRKAATLPPVPRLNRPPIPV